ncbi:MAG: DEAD/DEAH box helicase [Candidatus Saccharimonadales bacterium]
MSYKSSYHSSRPNGNNRRSSYNAAPRSNRRGPKKENIDPSRFIKVAQPQISNAYTPLHRFDDFDISTLIKRNLGAKGFVIPSAIQDKTIPLALQGRDVIGIADTGSGKTAAYVVPMVHLAITRRAKALVIAPTRELAQQIEFEVRWIAKDSRLRTATLIGGANISPQLRNLRDRPEIVVGTPGRIKDHLSRRSLRLEDFQYVVLDEVDRMLDMGFVNDVRQILDQLPSKHQSLYFSATLDPKVNALIDKFSIDPITISVKTGETGENIHQNVVRVVHDGQKLDRLHDLLIAGDIHKAIIFDDTQRSVERLSNELTNRGFKADAIHGGKNQGQRQRSLAKFRDNEVTILVATDVAARGIDVPDITHVINYSTPNSYSDYIHRIGRAGRAGRVGHALTFVTS